MLDELAPEMLATHKTVIWWRSKHVGHRVDQDLESVDVRLLWANFGGHLPTIRTRVQTTVRPSDEGFEGNFEALAQQLSTRVWEVYLYPLQQELFAELGNAKLLQLKRSARPYDPTKAPEGTITVAMDIGSVPPGADA